jgi:hypothetical protein
VTVSKDGLSHREEREYPEGMPLPSWAADAAHKITDTDSLVLIEGTLTDAEEYPVLLLARLTVVDEAHRVEFQVLAVINSSNIQEMIATDSESKVYQLSEIAHTNSNEAEGG